jgi:thiamine biosynthesis protein ThiI
MESVIVHYQEIALKGRNRPWFIDRLTGGLRDATADLDVTHVRPLMGRIEVGLGPAAEWPVVRERLGRVFGVANFARARSTGREVDEIAAAILRHLDESDAFGGDRVTSFRVRASRADKTYPLTSPQIEREVGGRIKAARGWRVDLGAPDLAIGVEILPDKVFCTVGKEPGQGGLPTGTSGAALCLLSGGIDSPVAAYRLMKRGCRVRFVHFHAYPILSRASLDKVHEIADLLTRHQLRSRLYAVRFGEIQQTIVLSAPPPLRVVLYRRMMMRIAERLAGACGAKALVTGESVGQVASQTIENLAVINDVVTLPVLRPLIGYDKEEITQEARRLGTYPVSIIPDQDCCTLFVPRRPATRARPEDVERAERNLAVEELVDRAVAEVERRDFLFPPRKEAPLVPAAADGAEAPSGSG